MHGNGLCANSDHLNILIVICEKKERLVNVHQIQSRHSQSPVEGFFSRGQQYYQLCGARPNSDACAVIDSVLDLDYASGTIGYIHADMIIDFIETHQLSLEWLIETHVHADHLSAAPYIQQKLGGKIGIAEQIVEVQQVFGKMFNAGTEFQRDGSQFDFLFNEGSQYAIGGMSVSVMHTPGHTPACMTRMLLVTAFVGDTLFMPDGGTARADFPGGDAAQLYHSIQRILSLRGDPHFCLP